MRRMNVLALSGLVALGVAAMAVPHRPASADTGFRVVDETGRPIAGAAVRTGAPGPGLLRHFVAADGYYPAVHTARAGEALADVVLVARAPERRLLVFAGDAMLARRYFEPRAGEPVLVRRDRIAEDGRRLLAHVRPYLELADVASVNLETQLSSAPLTDRLPKSVTFWSPAELAGLLQESGVDYVALGNNHTFDYGDEGVAATLEALAGTTLGHSGMGHDEATARAPYRTAVDGSPYAFLSYVGWAGTFEPSQVAAGEKGGAALGNGPVFREDLGALDAGTVTVLQHHSGLEYAEEPALTERTALMTAIDAGADVVIGHHAHVLQGLDVYRDRLVAYSMGNFLFDQYFPSTQLGMLLYVWMDGDTLHRAEVVPLDINGYVPTPATGSYRYAVLNRVARLSYLNGLCLEPSGAHAAYRSTSACGRNAVAAPDGTGVPLALWQAGASPLSPVRVDGGDRQYRVGIDLMPRGDFETAGLYGTSDRTWLGADGTRIRVAADGKDSAALHVTAPGGETVRTGMKVFERAYRPSTPATLSGRVRADGAVEVRFLLQRRRPDDRLADALLDGPVEEIGRIVPDGNWAAFSFDHALPRVSTRSVRLLIEVTGTEEAGGRVSLDDLAWVEWRTPWIDAARGTAPPAFGTHLQTRPRP